MSKNINRLHMLIILDGWGINQDKNGNAVKLANTPNLDGLFEEYPNTQLLCSGEAVGLPEGIMGNSEVGHLNIGAGRIVYQDLLRIDEAIRQGTFSKNDQLNHAMSCVKEKGTTLHLMGLVSDGGVHSQLTHLFALLDMAKEKDVNVCVHAILDGRDTPPDSGVEYIKRLQEHMNKIECGSISTICGRFYAMDRDNRWERVQKAFQLYTRGEGIAKGNPVAAVLNAYDRKEADEFIKPIIITDQHGDSSGKITDGDGIIFFNFRADRAREITRAFTEPDFTEFERDPMPKLCEYVCMTLYDESFNLPVAFPPIHMDQIFGDIISQQGFRQLRIAETEKYAHVTYFFNGGEETPFALEDRCLIPSPRDVETYDLKPEMSAYEVTDEVLSRIKSNRYDLIVLNLANMDMVGHTGVLSAGIKAVEVVDTCVGKIINEVRDQEGALFITADHGNAEKMVAEDKGAHTAHTTHPVPFILVDDSSKSAKLRTGSLCDIAPTILCVMGIQQPEKMTGNTLIES
ncbi:MAG: 2,3-bisphosphoglycerate-independent phosphoglycerate mutase [Deltaproteobacteria bacterium]|nr:2,3-bisphosphoglycerate-independent phosphoglycerate mutase [Deltaproteobacteria bacterium]MBW1845747.1 2,3-bisphosphoglycerate-independent phosphoglycerate mutase [Deltaproteobacteria bacterium]MBW1983671.1 2,3-bisphosphoglycerate-independent phosphoglycerate mutase [Deltaproteobacteria bacterium]MBW2364095.1 2,3-bisphosphoglycerate-independent phosphoglycerate mutase [Deltaproteobacteria bacterium]